MTADPDSPQPDSYIGPPHSQLFPRDTKAVLVTLLLDGTRLFNALPQSQAAELFVPTDSLSHKNLCSKTSVSISLTFISLLLSLPVVKAHRLSLGKKFLAHKRLSFSAYK